MTANLPVFIHMALLDFDEGKFGAGSFKLYMGCDELQKSNRFDLLDNIFDSLQNVREPIPIQLSVAILMATRRNKERLTHRAAYLEKFIKEGHNAEVTFGL